MSALPGRLRSPRSEVRIVWILGFAAAAFSFPPVLLGQQLFESPDQAHNSATVSDLSFGSVLQDSERLAMPVGEKGGQRGSVPTAPSPATDGSESFADISDLPLPTGSYDSPDGCQADCNTSFGSFGNAVMFPNGTRSGMLKWMPAWRSGSNACWTGRADALLLWRNAPQAYPLAVQTAGTGYPTFNANQLESTPAAGPRFQIFRTDSCGRTWEWAYLRGFNFRSQRVLPSLGTNSYVTEEIFGNSSLPFDKAFVNLGSGLQTFEMNYRFPTQRAWRLLAGFRWLEWREAFSMQTNDFGTPASDVYQTNVFNSLYGGQIGADVLLLTLPWLKVDSVIKAGAYYNNAVQRSALTATSGGTTQTLSVAVDQDPASCGFVGELELNAAIPLTNRIDIRIGYEGLWLASIAQPTDQLAGQQIVIGQPAAGTLDTGGSVVVQGVSLGLEGRW